MTDGIIGWSKGPGRGRYSSSDRQQRADLMGVELEEALRVGEHYWLANAVHRVNPPLAEDHPLGLESLRMIVVACFICEEPWSTRVDHRRCVGDINHILPRPPR